MRIDVLFNESPATVKLHFTKTEKKHFDDVASMCESIAQYMAISGTALADYAKEAASLLTLIVERCMDGVTESEATDGN